MDLLKEAFIEGYKQRAESSYLIFDNASRMYAISLFDKWKSEQLLLHNVSNRDSKLLDLVLHVGKDGVIQVFDQDNNAVLYEGTEIECKDFISGFNGC